jgi:DNA-binding GntR family transcriptional regulator
MDSKSVFTNLDVDELKSLLKESISETIKEELSTLLSQTEENNGKELLSRRQVADLYNVSFVTLRDWEKNKIIPRAIRKGTRVYWRKADILNDVNRKEEQHAH